MLIVPGDEDCRSAGSFFKNPIISEEQFGELQTRAGSNVPRYPASRGNVKTAAAWLIASRRGEWRELLAATLVTVAIALPVLVLSAVVETYVSPYLLRALAGVGTHT